MPQLSIQGKKLNRIMDAQVEVHHGNAKEALQIPIQQFRIKLPLDHDTMLAEWALAPQGPGRWKTAELETLDRSRKVNHTWTLHKAYVHEYNEFEFTEASGTANEQGNHVELIIRGTLMHTNVDYDGQNILKVAAGEPEPGTS